MKSKVGIASIKCNRLLYSNPFWPHGMREKENLYMREFVHVDILYTNILLNFKAQYLELQSEAHPIMYIT